MTFCLKHAMPEVHSPNQCGVQLKAKIRHEWVTQKKTEIKNGVIVQTEKPLKDWERTYLQKKLQDKVSELGFFSWWCLLPSVAGCLDQGCKRWKQQQEEEGQQEEIREK
jgi:hypothetical protein